MPRLCKASNVTVCQNPFPPDDQSDGARRRTLLINYTISVFDLIRNLSTKRCNCYRKDEILSEKVLTNLSTHIK
jgi:hypothetical protein